MIYARYQEGLNEFQYCASLNITHPSIVPDVISKTLDMTADRSSQAGEKRNRNPELIHEFSKWQCSLPLEEGNSIATFLAILIKQLRSHRQFLCKLSDEGGSTECFIGIFVDRLCDQVYPHEVLQQLAELRIDLRLDIYGPKQDTHQH